MGSSLQLYHGHPQPLPLSQCCISRKVLTPTRIRFRQELPREYVQTVTMSPPASSMTPRASLHPLRRFKDPPCVRKRRRRKREGSSRALHTKDLWVKWEPRRDLQLQLPEPRGHAWTVATSCRPSSLGSHPVVRKPTQKLMGRTA